MQKNVRFSNLVSGASMIVSGVVIAGQSTKFMGALGPVWVIFACWIAGGMAIGLGGYVLGREVFDSSTLEQGKSDRSQNRLRPTLSLRVKNSRLRKNTKRAAQR